MGFVLCLVILAMAVALFFIICPIVIIALSTFVAKIASAFRFNRAAVFVSYFLLLLYLAHKCYFVFQWQTTGNPTWLSWTGMTWAMLAGLWWYLMVWRTE